MENEFNKIRVRKTTFKVIIYTQANKIFGTIHTMPGDRLIDFMNSKAADTFVVVTDASVYSLPEENLIQSTEYFAINRQAIMMIFPQTPGNTVPSKKQT
jgi:hypothetical protein